MSAQRKYIIPIFDYTTVSGFERMYRAYFGKMHKIAFLKTKSYDTAGSLVQDVFSKVWENRNELIIEGSAENYLMRALRNRILNHFRDLALQRKHELEKAQETELIENPVENEIQVQELQQRLDKLVNQLPKKSQKIYRLSKDKEMTGREISKYLLIPERTISRHLAKALSLIKSGLGKDYTSIK